MKKLTLFVLLLTLAGIASAQTTSGLLTGPVTYTSPLNVQPYGWPNNTISFGDGTSCTIPNCPIVTKYVVGSPYYNLQANDGTSNGIPNCYTWDVWQLIMNDLGYCQTSFHGGGSGETRVALYCANSISSDINGAYTLSCTASWDGGAITVIGGVDTPIPTLYTVNVTILHHPVSVWISGFRRPRHLETWQAVDSAVVTVTPPMSAIQPAILGGVQD